MIAEGRQKGIPRELRICKSCDLGCVEDEYHFVIICPAYKNLRKKFIPNKFLKFTSILIFKNYKKKSWELESMPQTQPYLVNVADCQ